MYFDDAEGMVFRPPSEANSLILRVTIGCSHNACTFCSMYKDVKFRVRSMEEITALLDKAIGYYPQTRRVFLADGNALSLSTDKLLAIMAKLRVGFPKLSRITCYGGPQDILRKTDSELSALKQAGLQIIYLGIESGDQGVLTAVNKGVSAAEMITAGQKVVRAGIKLSAMVILGLGGKASSHDHAVHTAEVVSAIQPTMLSALTLMLHDGSPLRRLADQGVFLPLSPYELLLELQTMINNIQVTSPCIFRSNHVSNLLPLAGTLPQDKAQLLETIAKGLSYFKDKQMPTYNDINNF